jgi:hypothetical protein
MAMSTFRKAGSAMAGILVRLVPQHINQAVSASLTESNPGDDEAVASPERLHSLFTKLRTGLAPWSSILLRTH